MLIHSGVIPRAAQKLFEKLGSNASIRNNTAASSGIRAPSRYSVPNPTPLAKSGEKDWVMKATYVEIYNEQLRDLLLPENTPAGERNTVSIREDTKGRILLTGLHQVTINTIEDLLGALNHGSLIRQTDATAINAKSSRSHAVFSINLIQRKSQKPAETPAREKRFSVPTELMMNSASNDSGFITVDSKLHFVDLAGSERLKVSFSAVLAFRMLIS
jgi:Kinesin motor domain